MFDNPYRYLLDYKPHEFTSAQKSLQNALLRVLKRKALVDITVKELCIAAHVARGTFYTYYQNVDELLVEIEDHLTWQLINLNGELMERGLHKKEELRFYALTLDFVRENYTAIYTLLVTQPDLRFIEKWKKAIKYHFWERLFTQRTAKNSSLILEIVASSAISAYTFYLKNPNDVDTENIYDIIASILRMLDYDS